MRPHKHAGAEALDDGARRIELLDRRNVRTDAVLATAPIEHPDVPSVAIDRDAGRRADLSSRGKFEEAVSQLIRRSFGRGVLGDREY
jgi:hypothetical protein